MVACDLSEGHLTGVILGEALSWDMFELEKKTLKSW